MASVAPAGLLVVLLARRHALAQTAIPPPDLDTSPSDGGSQSHDGSADDDDDDDDDGPGSASSVPPPDVAGPTPPSGGDDDGPSSTSPSRPQPLPPSNKLTTPPPKPDPAAAGASVTIDAIQSAKTCDPLTISWHAAPADGQRHVALQIHPHASLSKRAVLRSDKHRMVRRAHSSHVLLPRAVNQTITPPAGVALSDGKFVWQQVNVAAGSYELSLSGLGDDGRPALYVSSMPFKVDQGATTRCLSPDTAPPPVRNGVQSNSSGGKASSSGNIIAAVVLPLIICLAVVALWIRRRRRDASTNVLQTPPDALPYSKQDEIDGYRQRQEQRQAEARAPDTSPAAPRLQPGVRRARFEDDPEVRDATTFGLSRVDHASEHAASEIDHETFEQGHQLTRSASTTSNFSVKRKPVPAVVLQRTATVCTDRPRESTSFLSRLSLRLSRSLLPFEGGEEAAQGSNRTSHLGGSQQDGSTARNRESVAASWLPPPRMPCSTSPSDRGSCVSQHRDSALTIEVTWQPDAEMPVPDNHDGPVSATPTMTSFFASKDSAHTARSYLGDGEEGPRSRSRRSSAMDNDRQMLHSHRRQTSSTLQSMTDSIYPYEVLVATRAVAGAAHSASLASLSEVGHQRTRTRAGSQGSVDSFRVVQTDRGGDEDTSKDTGK